MVGFSLKMFECLPYGAVVVSKDLSVLYGNPQFCSWFRQTGRSIRSKPFCNFLVRDDAKVFSTHCRKLSHFNDSNSKNGTAAEFDLFLQTGNTVRKAIARIKMLPATFFGTVDGVSENEAWYCTLEQKPCPEDWDGAVLVELAIWGTFSYAAGLVEKNATRLDTAYGGAVVAASLDGKITWMNTLAEKWFGIDKGEARGQNVAILIAEPTSDFHQSFLVRFNTQRKKGKAPVYVNTSKPIVSYARNAASGEDFLVQIVLALRTEANGREVIYARITEHTEVPPEVKDGLSRSITSESCPEPTPSGVSPLPLKETTASRGTAEPSRGGISQGMTTSLQPLSNRSHMTALSIGSKGVSNDGDDHNMARNMASTGIAAAPDASIPQPVSVGEPDESVGRCSEKVDEEQSGGYFLDLNAPGRTDLDREVLILESHHDFVLMRTVVEQGGTGVVVCDPSGEIIHASESALKLMNRPRKDIEHNQVETLMCDAHTREHHSEYIANYFSRGRKGSIVNGPARRVQMARGDGMAPLPINLYVGEARMANRKLVLLGLISSAERADQALRAHDKIELAVNSITTSHFELGARAFFHLDEKGVIRDCRGHLERLMTSLEAGGSAFLAAASEEEMQMIETESESEEEEVKQAPQLVPKPAFKSRGNATMRIGEVSQRGAPKTTNRQQQATNRQQQATNRQQQATNRLQQATNRAMDAQPSKSKNMSSCNEPEDPQEPEVVSPRRKVHGSKLGDIVQLFIEGSQTPLEKGEVTYARTFPKARLRGFPADKSSCTVHLAYSQDALGCRCGSQWYGCISLNERRMQEVMRGLDEAQSWMHGVVMEAPDGILIFTNENIVERGNKVASEILGCNPEGIVGRNVNEIFPGMVTGNSTLYDAVTKKIASGVQLDKIQQEYVPEGWLEAKPVNPLEPSSPPGRAIVKVAQTIINKTSVTIMFFRDVQQDRKDVIKRNAEMEKQQQILKHAGEAVVVADSDGVIEMFNTAAEAMFRTKASEAIGKDLGILMPKVVADQHPGYIAAYRSSGQRTMLGQTNCVRAQRLDGEPFAADVRPMEAIVGSRRVFVGVIRDVSTLVTARKDMKQRETKLKKTIVSGPGCMVICDETGVIKSATEATDKIIGHKFKSLVGKDISFLIPPGESDNHSELIKEFVAKIDGDDIDAVHGAFQAVDGYVKGYKKSPLDSLNKLRLMSIARADGEVAPCEVMIMMSTINGKRMFTVHIREASKSNEDLTMLTANISLAQRLHEQCPEVVVSTDDEGTIVAFNKVAEAVFKHRANDVIGKNCSVLMPPEVAAIHEDKMKAYGRNSSTAKMVGRTTVQDGISKAGDRLSLSITLMQSVLCGRITYTAMMENITDDIRIKMECARKDRELAAVVNSSSTALLMTDRAGKILECSTLLAQMFGYFLKDLIGQNVKVLMRRQEREVHDLYMERYMQTGEANILGERRLVSCRHAEGEVFPAFLLVESLQVSRSHCFVAVFEEGRDSQSTEFLKNTANHAHFLIPRCQDTMAAAALEHLEDDPGTPGSVVPELTYRSNMVTQRSAIPTQRSQVITQRSTQSLVRSSERGNLVTNRSSMSRRGESTSRSLVGLGSRGSPDGRKTLRTSKHRSISPRDSFGEPLEAEMPPPLRSSLRQMSSDLDGYRVSSMPGSPGSPIGDMSPNTGFRFLNADSSHDSRVNSNMADPILARSKVSLSPVLAEAAVKSPPERPKRSKAQSRASSGSGASVPPIRALRNNSVPVHLMRSTEEHAKVSRRGSAYLASIAGGRKQPSASVGDPIQNDKNDQRLLKSLKSNARGARSLSFESDFAGGEAFGAMMNAKFDNDRDELEEGETLFNKSRGPLSPPATPRGWERESAYREFSDSISQSSMQLSRSSFKDGVVEALKKLDAEGTHAVINMYDLDRTTGAMHYLFSHIPAHADEATYSRMAQARTYTLGECIVGDAGQRKRVMAYTNVCQAEGFTRVILAAEAAVGPALVIPIHYKTTANGKVGSIEVIVGVMEVFFPMDSMSEEALEREQVLWAKVALECGSFYQAVASNHVRSVNISRKLSLGMSQSNLLLSTRPRFDGAD